MAYLAKWADAAVHGLLGSVSAIKLIKAPCDHPPTSRASSPFCVRNRPGHFPNLSNAPQEAPLA